MVLIMGGLLTLAWVLPYVFGSKALRGFHLPSWQWWATGAAVILAVILVAALLNFVTKRNNALTMSEEAAPHPVATHTAHVVESSGSGNGLGLLGTVAAFLVAAFIVFVAIWIGWPRGNAGPPGLQIAEASAPAKPDRMLCDTLHDGESHACASVECKDITIAVTDGTDLLWGDDFDRLAAEGRVQYWYKETAEGPTLGPVTRTGSATDKERTKVRYLICGAGKVSYETAS
jgi:hypothetical protein